MKKIIIAVCCLCSFAAFTGCGASRTSGWERQVQEQTGNEQEVLAQAEEKWQNRINKADLEMAIELYQKAASINPKNLVVLSRIARAYYFLADGHYLGNPEKQIEIYDLGAAAGEKALALDEGFRSAKEHYSPETLGELGQEYVPAIYWTASCLGKWARLKGFVTLLKVKGKVKALVEAATNIDNTYFYYAPDRYWGVYYSVAPSFAGGDIEKSKKHFEATLQGSPNYLGSKVLYADTYATKVQDKELYIRLLNEVIDGDNNSIPEINAEQMKEQEKAKLLLDPEVLEDRFAD